MASQAGINIRNCITNNRFLDFFMVLRLRIAFDQTFMKIDHCCGGFESKIRRVGKILTK